MTRLNYDEYFVRMLNLVSARSTCSRRAVGAIIVDSHHHILATGYNGVPRHITHCIQSPCEGVNDPHGDTSRCLAVHAEANALLQCHRLDLAYKMYTSCSPCFDCAKMICNTGIQNIVSLEEYTDKRGNDLFYLSGLQFYVHVSKFKEDELDVSSIL
jgi:dCMP deaminase